MLFLPSVAMTLLLLGRYNRVVKELLAEVKLSSALCHKNAVRVVEK